jgi:hypothetical protein
MESAIGNNFEMIESYLTEMFEDNKFEDENRQVIHLAIKEIPEI